MLFDERAQTPLNLDSEIYEDQIRALRGEDERAIG